MFNYIAYRVFEYFEKKDNENAVSKTINFLSLFQGTFLILISFFINLFIRIDLQIFQQNNKIKYYIGIPLAIILIIINNIFIKKKLVGEPLNELKNKYHKKKYLLPIGVIFAGPIFFVFVIPIIYGILNGTINFPFLNN